MNSADADLRSRIVGLVKSILGSDVAETDIVPSASLVDLGLTSMDMVDLMLGLESEFDFMIPQDQITPENFQSIEALERLVTAQLPGAQAA